jgi:hypothetical protein
VSDEDRKKARDITTVHLGQYDRETANAIAGRLERAKIVWWYKEPGFFSQIWEYGVRLFVDRDRLEEARQIAERVSRKQAAKRAAREAEERAANGPEEGESGNAESPDEPQDSS